MIVGDRTAKAMQASSIFTLPRKHRRGWDVHILGNVFNPSYREE
jgi:hypothetical protein